MFAKLLSFVALIKGTAAAGLFARVLRKVANFIAPRKPKEREVREESSDAGRG